MLQLFNIVLVSMVALVARGQVPVGDLCQQSTEVRQTICAFVNMCSNNNRNLLVLVRDKQAVINEKVFELHDPQNVTSVNDFYQELVKYNNIFRGLDVSVRAYMSTPEYAVDAAIASVATMATTFLRRLNIHITYIQQTTEYISENVVVASPTTTLVNVAVRKLNQIYAETYYVTNKMSALLVSWSQNCSKSC